MAEGIRDISPVNPDDYVITRKRKKYRFALFHNSPLCYELDEWDTSYAPQVIEFGAGTGIFSVEQATSHPEGSFLAVDVKGDRMQKGAGEAATRGLSNIRFLRARADQVREKLTAHTVDIVWITFPDPFAKKRSAGRRLTHPHFLDMYADLLKADGALYFKTDSIGLFKWSLEKLVEEGWGIKELSFDLHESNLPNWYKVPTAYEARFISEGLKIHFVKAVPPRGSK